jgi:opine dehydrogenase
MRIAILGAGAIGCGTAAFLRAQGHEAVLWSPSGRRVQNVRAHGAVEGNFHPETAESCAAALAAADCALIAVPGYAHRAVIEAAAPHLGAAHTVLFSSHMSFSALYLRLLCPDTAVVAWGTTVVTGRMTGEAEVWVTNIRSRVDVATVPEADGARGLALCRAAFGDRFLARQGLIAIALSNLNPQNHLAIALCNLTRMEKGEAWKQYANTTPAVGRLMEALDAERIAVAAAFGVSVRSIHEHFRLSFGAEGATMGAMAAHLAAQSNDPNGPATLDSRYVVEDVPFGLWPTVCLGRIVGVETPLHAGGVALFSALYGRDFAGENDILPLLGDLSGALRAAGEMDRRMR